MPIYEETSGTHPDDIYELNQFGDSSWGLSWGFSWGRSWGFINIPMFSTTSGESPETIYET